MKRNRLFITMSLVTLLVTGCGAQQAQMKAIGIEPAKAAALEAAGFTKAEATVDNVELLNQNGQEYYKVDFSVNGESFSYEIDALTGKLLSQNGSSAANVVQDDQQVSDTTVAQTPAENQQTTSGNSNDQLIDEEKAKELAMEHAGVSSDEVTFVKSGLDRDDGRRVYDVEFYSKDFKEYDYDIDAVTGEILSFDHDAEYYAPAKNGNSLNNSDSGSAISEEDAKALVLSQVPGATEKDIWEFEVDYDDGRVQYEGKLYYDHMEYEFEIDGYSGAIRNWEVESIYD